MGKHLQRGIKIFLSLALLGLLFWTRAVEVNGSSQPGTVLLDRGDARGLAWLQGVKAVQLYDYGSFSLWQLPSTATPSLASQPALRQVSSQIKLRGLTIDSSLNQPEPALPSDLQSASPAVNSSRLWILQFAGPIQDTWLEKLKAAGQSVVTCLPEYACILWGANPTQAAAQFGPLARWQGPFHPAYRLHPNLRPGAKLRAAAGAEALAVTVQVLDVPAAQASLDQLAKIATQVGASHKVLNMLNLRASIPASRLDEAAALPAVFNIEPAPTPVLNDEMQAQILAGNILSTINGTAASGPGYLAWLKNNGVSTNPSDYPVLDIVDDGIDTGDVNNILHPDFYAYPSGGSAYSRIVYLNSCLANGTKDGDDGHGNLNAGIAAGYNDKTSGFPYQDASGYSYGLGISPYGRLAGTKVFVNGAYDVSTCDGSYTGIVKRAYGSGAQMTSNSWGDANALSGYDAGAQEYDALTRDADPDLAGNQEMLHVFSAGNSGGSATIGSPGTAKNVITVGATSFPRAGFSGDADSLAYYSSRGPTLDGRIKPDLVAPGSFIQGPASQDPLYNGSGVSGGKYFPPGQTLYTFSNGTSHSAPSVSGAAQLTWQYYKATYAKGNTPSPAMVKALLLNSARYLNGNSTGGNLPSNNQGWGMPDIANIMDGSKRMLVDQTITFGASGQEIDAAGIIPDISKPFKVSLVWTDAPGSTVSSALVNDLDLEVTVGGTTYLGNVFSGAYSSSGGSADGLNNVESVYLPAGSGTSFSLRVIARNIAGDGVPGNADPTDQDFALVVYNANPAPDISATMVWQEDPAGSDQNGVINAGEKALLNVTLHNTAGAVTASSINGTLQVLNGPQQVLDGQSAYPDLSGGSTAANQSSLRIQVSPTARCGDILKLALNLSFVYQDVNGSPINGSKQLFLPQYPVCNYYRMLLPLVISPAITYLSLIFR